MRNLPANLLEHFEFEGISILKDNKDRCVLILVCRDADAKSLMYALLQNIKPTIFTVVDPATKIYNVVLQFFYQAGEYMEYRYNTLLTSKEYPSLLWLNNCTVQYITSGISISNSKKTYSYSMPLIPLNCINQN